jgi:DNA (cytosine-5)-methyltransferase 1
MRYLSVCSGIEAATMAWHPLGWTPVAFSDIEPFPSAVLAHHYPNVPNLGDMTKYETWNLKEGDIDLLVGGTPCQSFSVAGLRGGLKDPRGGLMLTYLEIAERLRPRWIVWENVPGVLSSNGGRDFGSFLGALGQLGYGWSYRVLDSQWIRTQRHPNAVPQRRRRVFVVGCLGDTTSAAKVLFERQSLLRDSTSRRKKSQEIAFDSGESTSSNCITSHEISPCLETTCHDYSRADGFTIIGQPTGYRWQNNRDGLVEDGSVGAIRASTGDSGFHEMNHPLVLQPFTKSKRAQSNQDDETWVEGDVAPTQNIFDTGDTRATTAVVQSMTVRRLTPIECERLQGFPDNYTCIPWKNKSADECPDGPRYRALGNSMAVNCMEWIGERIAMVDSSRS